MSRRVLCTCVLSLCCVLSVFAQQSSPAGSAGAVPPLVNFSGVLTPADGGPATGMVGITFLLYKDSQGGVPLWMETQNVQPDKSGHYSVVLGSTSGHGLPADLFAAGQGRWLGVQPQGEPEQPRVLMVSVPYALKAADAETIGGLPPSAFMLAPPPTNSAPGAASSSQSTASTTPAVSGTGTTDFLPLWLNNSGALGNSVLFQSGSGGTAKVGINTVTPATALDVNGWTTVRGALIVAASGTASASGGKNSEPLSLVASAFNSGTGKAQFPTFHLQAEPTGNDTSSPSGTLNLLFTPNAGAPSETGFRIASNGLVHFVSGQTFPGTGSGTVTSVGSGAGLTGGPITGSGTLSIASAGVTNTMLQHSSLTVTAGTGLIGGGAVSLGGSTALHLASASCPAGSAAVALPLTCLSFATLGANSFHGNQAVTGNLSATGEVSAGGTPTGNVGSGNIEVDAAGANNGGFGPGLTFGGGGETIVSNRAGSTNQYGFDFFTNYTPRMSITNTGLVGIGVQSPGWMLEVSPPDNSRIFGSAIFGANDTGSGVGASYALYTAGGYDITSIPSNSGGLGAFLVGGSSNVGYGGDGVDAWAGSGALLNGYAGYFNGDVHVAGNLSKSSGSFKIDHPLDPADKYLYHSFVESPDMMNIYNGNVALDANGEAVVELPEWFGAVNRDYRYQLTCIGGFAPVYIAEEISNNQFRIAGGKSGMKVSWTVTGIRQDAWANAHRIPVEVNKPAHERGYYIHPELYGAPEEKSIDWARHPDIMKRMKADREKHLKPAQGNKP